jgi:hypothetical protein
MHWDEQRCHQCGQIIGTDCMFVTTTTGIVHPDCWDTPHVFHESPTFAEILANTEEQAIVRQLLKEFMPVFEQGKLVAKFTKLMRLRQSLISLVRAHDPDEKAEGFLRERMRTKLVFLHNNGTPDAGEADALEALLGQCGQETGGPCRLAGTMYCEDECPFSKGGAGEDPH